MSTTIYAQTNDNYTFELRDNQDTVLQTTTVPLVQGQNRVDLNFDVPVGNDFELGVPAGTVECIETIRESIIHTIFQILYQLNLLILKITI